MGRTHPVRLIAELNEIRDELAKEVAKLEPGQFDSSPAPAMEMKTCKALLREIGSMEKICMGWLIQQKELDWEKCVTWSGDDAESHMKDLAAVRAETLAYLKDCTEEKLETAVALPESWYQYFN